MSSRVRTINRRPCPQLFNVHNPVGRKRTRTLVAKGRACSSRCCGRSSVVYHVWEGKWAEILATSSYSKIRGEIKIWYDVISGSSLRQRGRSWSSTRLVRSKDRLCVTARRTLLWRTHCSPESLFRRTHAPSQENQLIREIRASWTNNSWGKHVNWGLDLLTISEQLVSNPLGRRT